MGPSSWATAVATMCIRSASSAAAMTTIVTDRARARAMGVAGRAHVARSFSRDVFAAHLKGILDAVATPGGLRVARDDGKRTLKHEVFEFWPPDLLEMFKQAGVPRKTPPPLEANAESLVAADAGAVPKIVSPRAALVYTLQASDAARQKIPLRADSAPGVKKENIKPQVDKYVLLVHGSAAEQAKAREALVHAKAWETA